MKVHARDQLEGLLLADGARLRAQARARSAHARDVFIPRHAPASHPEGEFPLTAPVPQPNISLIVEFYVDDVCSSDNKLYSVHY